MLSGGAEQFAISIEREESIARLSGCTPDYVREWIYYDWPNWEEHCAWLRSATDEEIADWICKTEMPSKD